MNSSRLRLLFTSCAWLFLAAAQAADKPGRLFAPGQQKVGTAKPHGPPSREMSGQLFESVEAGDSYATPEGPRKLRRLAGAIAIPADEKQSLAGYEAEARSQHGIRVLRATDSEKRAQLGTPVKLDEKIRQLRGTAAGRSANPVFIDPQTGLRLLATTNVIICLKPGVDARAAFGAAWARVKPLAGTVHQFLLALPGANADEVFAEVNRLSARLEVEWAEPDFLMQVRKSFTPNDPLFSDQWHLRNIGQLGGRSGADAKLTSAWDITRGSSNIVIAIIDDGVQMNHPDLAANIFINPGEIPGNGTDDDDNGFIDDVNGWDFYGNGTIGDNNPGPSAVEDNHGTALAGVASGVGNNSLGISGAAPGCRIMPVKIIEGDDGVLTSELGGVLRYAGGLTGGTNSTWRGADVINISLTFSSSSTINSALVDVSTKGHGGRGVPIFCAAGNDAGAWRPVDLDFAVDDVHTLSWEYSKDTSDIFSTGADTVWLDSVVFPDGTIEDFEGNGLPPDWVTGGTDGQGWTQVTAGVNGNRAMIGWNGPGSRSLRAGSIGNNGLSWLDLTTSITAGRLTFWIWTESEAGENRFGDLVGYDGFEFLVDGTLFANDFGVPILETSVGYPASSASTIAVGASTDFDFRADYSQSGSALDFLAPSDGGLNGIATTDRTGGSGYVANSDYDFQFGGTSSATPLASGIAALLLSVNPFLTAAELRALMRSNCDKIGGETYDANGRNNHYGYGRVNAARALAKAKTDLSVSVAISPALILQGEVSLHTITVHNLSAASSGPVVVEYQLPDRALFASAQPFPSFQESNVVRFSSGGIAAGGVANFIVEVTNPFIGDQIANVSITCAAPEFSLSNNFSFALAEVVIPPNLSINGNFLTEGDNGSRNLSFTVLLSSPSSRRVSVNFATVPGTATTGSDFVFSGGTIEFLPGQTAKTIFVAVVGDILVEDDETFTVNLNAPINAMISHEQATGTILDNDTPPDVSISDATLTEGDAKSTNLIFTVSLSNPSPRNVTVNYATASVTAVIGRDFASAGGSLKFLPGETSKTITVRVLNDRLDEEDETFTVNLSAVTGAILARTQAIGTILDNDPLPALSVANQSRTEGNAGAAAMVFSVKLTPASGRPVSVRCSTVAGSAAEGSDFLGTNGVLVFAAGKTLLTFSVPIVGDQADETNETFSLVLGDATNAVITAGTATGTILDNDAPPRLYLGDASVIEGDSDTTNLVFNVRLTPGSGRPVSVLYFVTNGSATAGVDFAGTNATLLEFPPGVMNQTITVPVFGDMLSESNETVVVRLFAPTNATLGDATALGTIIDDDLAPALSIADATAGEPATGGTNALFAVTLSAASGRTIKVNFATSNLTARAGADFTRKTGTLTFAPGMTNLPLNIPVLRDALSESNETFLVQLLLPVNATLGAAQGIGTILGSVTLARIGSAAAGPRLSLTGSESGRLHLSFASTPGRSYILEARDTLEDAAPWQEVSDVAPLDGTGGTLNIELPLSAKVSQRFYRLRFAE